MHDKFSCQIYIYTGQAFEAVGIRSPKTGIVRWVNDRKYNQIPELVSRIKQSTGQAEFTLDEIKMFDKIARG